VTTLLQDLRYAVRSLRRTPGFTSAAVLTLALGIGATLAVFSVVNVVLLEPLPYSTPERIAAVSNRWDGTERGRISPAEYFDYLRGVAAFDAFGVYRGGTLTITYENGEPERLPAGFMTFGVLPALGVAPTIGVPFEQMDDAPGADDKVLISDGLWKRRFGASTTAIGRRLVLDGRAHIVVGVMPPAFRLPDEFSSREPAQLFVPLKFPPQVAQVRVIIFSAVLRVFDPVSAFRQRLARSARWSPASCRECRENIRRACTSAHESRH
jgi:hypothetical protein